MESVKQQQEFEDNLKRDADVESITKSNFITAMRLQSLNRQSNIKGIKIQQMDSEMSTTKEFRTTKGKRRMTTDLLVPPSVTRTTDDTILFYDSSGEKLKKSQTQIPKSSKRKHPATNESTQRVTTTLATDANFTDYSEAHAFMA